MRILLINAFLFGVVFILRNLSSDETAEEDLWEGAVWKPGQEPDEDDSLRAAEILLEECKR